MSMDRQDWIVRGRSDKDAGLEPRKVKEGTWQHEAYWKGYNSSGKTIKLGRGQSPLEVKELPDRVRGLLQGKVLSVLAPRAAQEHHRRLLADIDTCKNPTRKLRLIVACQRMLKRHGGSVPV